MSTNTTSKKATQRKLNPVPDEPVIVTENRQLSKDEAVTLAVVGTVIGSVVGVLSYFGWKADKAKQAKLDEEHAVRLAEAEAKAAELKAWFDHQRHAGRIVIETVDGEYMAIPAEAYATSEVIKREI